MEEKRSLTRTVSYEPNIEQLITEQNEFVTD